MTDLAVLIPVLARPKRVQPLVESIRTATPDAHILFIVDHNDHDERRAVTEAGCDMLIQNGSYAVKINAGVRATDEPLIFIGADDLRFHPGWYEIAMQRLAVGSVQVVGVNDLCSQRVRDGTHATHFLMTREYAEQPCIDGSPGPLCEVYKHNAVDDECFATARHRGVLAVASDSIVEHLHPDAGRGEWDATYRKGRSTLRQDVRILRRRSRMWA